MSKLSLKRPSKDRQSNDSNSVHKETVRLNINITKTIYKKLKAAAIEDDVSITALVTRMIIDYITVKK